MSGRDQMASTRRGGLRADAAKDKDKRNKDKRKDRKDKDDRKKRPTPRRLPPTQQGRQLDNSDFRLYLVESKKKRTEITEIVESLEWSESSDGDNVNSWPMLSATLSVRQSDTFKFPDLLPNRMIDCVCDGERIWRMRIVKPSFSAADGAVSLELQDELRQLALPRGNFRYVADKAHKDGWAPDEIARDICRQYKIPYRRFLVMRVNGTGERIRLAKVEKKKASPLDVIQYAYEEARKRSAHRYIMRWDFDSNKLEAVPMRESDVLYAFYSRQITSATVEVGLRKDFCTALRVTWYKPKPRKPSKKWKPKKETLTFRVYKDGKAVYSGRGKKKKPKTTNVLLPPRADEVIGKYGYIERRAEFSARSIKEARAKAKNELAKRLRPEKTLTFTVAGEPNVRRGDFLLVNLPDQGLDNKQVWVQSVSHSVTERYTMDVTARFDNPFSAAKIKREQQAAARYKKAAEKKEKGQKGGGSGKNLGTGNRPEIGVVYTLGASSYGFTAGDDNGKDVKGQSLFSGNPAVAELGQGGSVGGAMGLRVAGGGPDYGMQCRITYQGRSTIAYFRDVGSGGGPVKGKPRVIDLHARVAREIGFPNGLDLVQFERLS